MQAGEVERAVQDAVRLGVRHIDTGVISRTSKNLGSPLLDC